MAGLDCARCGANLEVSKDRLSCRYCGAVRPLPARPSRLGHTTLTLAISALLAVSALGGLVVLVLSSRASVPAPAPAPASTVIPPARSPPVHPPREEPPPPEPRAPPPPAELPASGGATAKTSSPPRPKRPASPPAPVVTKAEARDVLEPALKDCLKAHRVHRLIVRLGQGYDPGPGPYPPLTIVEEVHVDGFVVKRFGATPLGRCVLAAAKQIWTDAARGAYLHFDLRHDAVPDPLEGAPPNLERAVARARLTERDETARECGRRQLDGWRPRSSVDVDVSFRGADGHVTRVEPFYVEPGTPYFRCLQEAYEPVEVPPFRRLDARVVHRLTP